MKTVFIPNGSRVLPLSMRYASLAFRRLSLLDLISSSGISVMSLAEWSLVRKCSETVLSLEILDRLSTGQLVETVFESSFGFTYVLFRAVVALYHENDDFGVTVNVISDRCGFACSVECVWSLPVRYVFTSEKVFSAWVWSLGLVVLCDIAEFSPNLKITEVTTTSISYNGCSFKDVIATGGWNKDVKVFVNTGWDGTKGEVVGDNEGNMFCFV